MSSIKISRAPNKSPAAMTKKESRLNGSSSGVLSRKLPEARTRPTYGSLTCSERAKHGGMEPFSTTSQTSKSKIMELISNSVKLHSREQLIQTILISNLLMMTVKFNSPSMLRLLNSAQTSLKSTREIKTKTKSKKRTSNPQLFQPIEPRARK